MVEAHLKEANRHRRSFYDIGFVCLFVVFVVVIALRQGFSV